MSDVRKLPATGLVLQSFNLTRSEDDELRMIAARYKTRKSTLIRGAVALMLKSVAVGNQQGDGYADTCALKKVKEAGELP